MNHSKNRRGNGREGTVTEGEKRLEIGKIRVIFNPFSSPFACKNGFQPISSPYKLGQNAVKFVKSGQTATEYFTRNIQRICMKKDRKSAIFGLF